MKTSTGGHKTSAAAFELKRVSLTQNIADVLLAAGVAEIPLRELAARIDTSDRMLLYYFADKTELVQVSLHEVSVRLARLLGGSMLAKNTPDELLAAAIALLGTKAVAPFMRVWADLSARGSRGEKPYFSIAQASVQGWLAWVEQRLNMAATPARRRTAVAVLTVLEGARLIEAFAPGTTPDAVALLARSLTVRRTR